MQRVKYLWRRFRKSIIRGRRRSIFLIDRFHDDNIGRQSYGGLTVHRYDSSAKLTIGSFCSIADDVTIFLGGEHRSDWITTYPFNILDKRFAHIVGHPWSKGDVRVGSDVWIGRGAVILSGVCIGNGAVVGAFALVAKDVPDYAIVGGNPAKLIRMRFTDQGVEQLKGISWWNWSDERIARAVPYLQSHKTDEFLRLVGQGVL